jgi:hypothetical protein
MRINTVFVAAAVSAALMATPVLAAGVAPSAVNPAASLSVAPSNVKAHTRARKSSDLSGALLIGVVALAGGIAAVAIVASSNSDSN